MAQGVASSHGNLRMFEELCRRFQEVPQAVVVEVMRKNGSNFELCCQDLQQESGKYLYGDFQMAGDNAMSNHMKQLTIGKPDDHSQRHPLHHCASTPAFMPTGNQQGTFHEDVHTAPVLPTGQNPFLASMRSPQHVPRYGPTVQMYAAQFPQGGNHYVGTMPPGYGQSSGRSTPSPAPTPPPANQQQISPQTPQTPPQVHSPPPSQMHTPSPQEQRPSRSQTNSPFPPMMYQQLTSPQQQLPMYFQQLPYPMMSPPQGYPPQGSFPSPQGQYGGVFTSPQGQLPPHPTVVPGFYQQYGPPGGQQGQFMSGQWNQVPPGYGTMYDRRMSGGSESSGQGSPSHVPQLPPWNFQQQQQPPQQQQQAWHGGQGQMFPRAHSPYHRTDSPRGGHLDTHWSPKHSPRSQSPSPGRGGWTGGQYGATQAHQYTPPGQHGQGRHHGHYQRSPSSQNQYSSLNLAHGYHPSQQPSKTQSPRSSLVFTQPLHVPTQSTYSSPGRPAMSITTPTSNNSTPTPTKTPSQPNLLTPEHPEELRSETGTPPPPILPVISPASSHSSLSSAESRDRGQRPSTSNDNYAYEQALLLHQRARMEKLHKDWNGEKQRLAQVRAEVDEMERDLQDRRKRNATSKCPTVEEIVRKREHNRQLQIEIDCMTKETDLLQQSRYYVSDPVDVPNFYANLGATGQLGPVPPPSAASQHRRNLSSSSAPEGGVTEREGEGGWQMVNYTAEAPNPSAAPEEAEGPQWNCRACTFLNHPQLDKCEICEMPRVI
ncbi:TGF-beta-activated kinase 1 and MAP3K7-binding protein 3-like isoform X2 [Branchiostoma floridae]|uniref:TGF-beta-activated kinase 1 and MAP3K7-binding protein 3-like isoform X2 n=1 Tax=Branchiostoma floridae TaxID=7739 RepID=A0A9J7N2H3_BRAFL|nr:TGF-beta-activated kinase 1 and MAP3K7-binding protein 3-like isoform X2 [Branchiostoma floridae]